MENLKNNPLDSQKWWEYVKEWSQKIIDQCAWGQFKILKEDDFYSSNEKVREWLIVLNDGRFLVNRYGKYRPNLSFIQSQPHEIRYVPLPSSVLNLESWSFDYVRGRYFIYKKGTNCFEIQADGPHMLIRDDWWGAFSRYRWWELKKLPCQLYYRRASSNWWGQWYDYVIVPVWTRYQLSFDDL